MRTLRLVAVFLIATLVNVFIGNVFAQRFTVPSRLDEPAYGQAAPIVRYMDPAPRPLTVSEPELAPQTIHGAPYGQSLPCDTCGTPYGYGYSYNYWGCGCEPCCQPWYVFKSILYMSRDDNDPVEVAADPNNNDRELLGTQQVQPDDWRLGGEIIFGRRFGCGYRLEAGYWGLDPDHSSLTITDPAGQINASFNFEELDLPSGPIDGAGGWINNAEAMLKDYEGTPWANRAKWELARGFGVHVVQDWDDVRRGQGVKVPKL